MNTKDNGGPAFPLTNSHIELRGTDWESANGLSMRDYFAAKALSWVLEDTPVGQEFYKRAAQGAYRIADALLEARK